VLTVSGNLDDQKQERFWRAAAAASERLEGRNRTVSFAAVILGKNIRCFDSNMLFGSKPIEWYPQNAAGDSARKGHVLL
jgi:hypothetical protein